MREIMASFPLVAAFQSERVESQASLKTFTEGFTTKEPTILFP
jgi:hypothetical protein